MLKNLSRRSFPSFRQLFKDDYDDSINEERVPKGYVPVMFGNKENERAELFLIHVKMFKKAYFVELLEMAADEFGYEHQGVLQIPCDAGAFIKLVKQTSRAN